MGYAALRMAQKKDVTTVDVFEEDKDVIKMFEELYGEREEVEKIKIHEMDVRDLKGDTFHFFYMDIYPTMLEEEMLDDVEFFCDRNYVQEYRYWTQEKLLIAGLIEAPIRGLNKMLTEEDRELIQYWHQAKTGGTKLSQLYQRLGDNERIEGMLLKHKELNL